MNQIVKTIAILVIFGILVGVAYAQFAKPEDAVKYRQSVMFLIAQHFGRLGAVVKGRQPYDQETFAKNAAIIENLSALPWEAFGAAGSDKGKTTMKAKVLKDPAGFKKLAQQFQMEVGKLATAARGNDFNATKSQFGAVAKSCKACHSKFRK
jgi:cytochrome c556